MRTITVTLTALALLAAGCERSSPQASSSAKTSGPQTAAKAPAEAAPTTQPAAKPDLGAIASYVREQTGVHAPQPPGLPPGHPPIDQAADAMRQMAQAHGQQPSRTARLEFDPPAAWTSEKPANRMRQAQFVIPKAAGDPEDGQMILFFFGAGEGGPVQMNIARWRGQFTTSDGKPLPDSAVRTDSFEVHGLKVTTVEIHGRYAPSPMMPAAGPVEPKDNYRMLAAIVETPRGTFFFKGLGPDATMQAQREAFIRMLHTLRLAD